MLNNIDAKGYNECTGCSVCSVICPTKCITVKLDEDGFYKPSVLSVNCISCGLCKEVCYKFKKKPKRFNNFYEDKSLYGGWSKNVNVRKRSTSGGIGHELLLYGLKHSFSIAGVSYNMLKDKTEHIIVNNVSELDKLQGSKYIQSNIVNLLNDIDYEKKYIIVGTPCQIYGLRKYIVNKQVENNFILIDFFCHGVPSYLLWNNYIGSFRKQNNTIDEVRFRSKEYNSWHNYSMDFIKNNKLIYSKEHRDDLFYKFFFSDKCLNKSCYKCLLRLDDCASDIRLADFWGDKYKNSDQGVTLVAVNTDKGKEIFDNVQDQLEVEVASFKELQNSQPKRFIEKAEFSPELIELLKGDLSIRDIYKKTIYVSLFLRAFRKLKRIFIKYF